MKTISDLMNLARARADLGSDYKLAKEMHLHANYMYAWRAETRFPTPEQLLDLAELADEHYGYWLTIMYARKAPNAILASRFVRAAESMTT